MRRTGPWSSFSFRDGLNSLIFWGGPFTFIIIEYYGRITVNVNLFVISIFILSTDLW